MDKIPDGIPKPSMPWDHDDDDSDRKSGGGDRRLADDATCLKLSGAHDDATCKAAGCAFWKAGTHVMASVCALTAPDAPDAPAPPTGSCTVLNGQDFFKTTCESTKDQTQCTSGNIGKYCKWTGSSTTAAPTTATTTAPTTTAPAIDPAIQMCKMEGPTSFMCNKLSMLGCSWKDGKCVGGSAGATTAPPGPIDLTTPRPVPAASTTHAPATAGGYPSSSGGSSFHLIDFGRMMNDFMNNGTWWYRRARNARNCCVIKCISQKTMSITHMHTHDVTGCSKLYNSRVSAALFVFLIVLVCPPRPCPHFQTWTSLSREACA